MKSTTKEATKASIKVPKMNNQKMSDTKLNKVASSKFSVASSNSMSSEDEPAPMSLVELRFFKELLLEQRSEILNKADAFKADSGIESTGQGDEGDLAVSELNLSLSLRLQERQTQLLQKIDRALAKIEEGSFGLCEQCDEPLNVNRLKARPVASLCIACKEEQESKERVFA